MVKILLACLIGAALGYSEARSHGPVEVRQIQLRGGPWCDPDLLASAILTYEYKRDRRASPERSGDIRQWTGLRCRLEE